MYVCIYIYMYGGRSQIAYAHDGCLSTLNSFEMSAGTIRPVGTKKASC